MEESKVEQRLVQIRIKPIRSLQSYQHCRITSIIVITLTCAPISNSADVTGHPVHRIQPHNHPFPVREEDTTFHHRTPAEVQTSGCASSRFRQPCRHAGYVEFPPCSHTAKQFADVLGQGSCWSCWTCCCLCWTMTGREQEQRRSSCLTATAKHSRRSSHHRGWS